MVAILDASPTRQEYQTRSRTVAEEQPVTARLRERMQEFGQTQGWSSIIESLESIEALHDDWDGLGASAPSGEVLLTAVVLVHFWMENKKAPPSRVVASTAGTIVFEWQGTDGSFAEFEVDRPRHAEIMLKLPGSPTKHFEWPTH